MAAPTSSTSTPGADQREALMREAGDVVADEAVHAGDQPMALAGGAFAMSAAYACTRH
jgi:hypothetical protein